jgi:hypothetical protein
MNSSNFTQLFTDAPAQTQRLLITTTLKSLEYWGKRSSEDMHKADDALAHARETDTGNIDALQYRADTTAQQVLTLRKMWKELTAQLKDLELEIASERIHREHEERNRTGTF